MDELSPRDVILVVNGEKFTKKDFLVAVGLFDKISRLRAGDDLTGPNKNAEAAVKATNARTLSDMLRRALIRQYAQKHGISPSAELVESMAKESLVKMRRPNATMAEIAELFGGKEGRLLLEYNRGDALDVAMRHHFDKDKILNVTDDDIMKVSNKWHQAKANAMASNAVEKAILEKAIAEIKAGTDFAITAKKFSQTPEEGTQWDDFLLEEFDESPDVVKWLKTAQTGDVSGILELDDGWSVIKVLSRHKEEYPPAGISSPREMWLLVRISRRLYETAKELPRDEIIKGLTAYRSRKIQKVVAEAVMEGSVIEWPRGTNLFTRLTSKTKQQ